MPNDPSKIVDVNERHLMAALSYVGVLVFVPLLVQKNDPFVYFHVRQGLVVLGAVVIAMIATAWWAPVGTLLFVLVMIADIVALVYTLLGKRWRIPVLGTFAEKIKV